MKKYCINCGYANEYLGVTPIKCSKCKMDFSMATQKLTKAVQQSSQPEEIDDHQNFEDSEFDSYMGFKPERMTQDEIEALFLSNATKSVSIRDMVEDAKRNAPQSQASAKKRGRPAKKK